VWRNLLDPTPDELAAALERDVHDIATRELTRVPEHDDEPRPRFESHGSYILGVLVVPVCLRADDRIFYQEIDVVASDDRVVVVRKTPSDGTPADLDAVEREVGLRPDLSAGMLVFRIVDEVAERFLELTDDLHAEIEELEDSVGTDDTEHIRSRIGEVRHDLLRIRRTLGPTREAVHRIIDDRVELDGAELFPRNVELNLADAHEKLLRASEAVEFCRDLLNGVRDFLEGKIASDQNEVMKRLTVVASLLLVPTFIVGVYGQNFDHMPELHWLSGYEFSWLLIVVTTLGQLVYFRRKHWM
jgi:magnesium transporter